MNPLSLGTATMLQIVAIVFFGSLVVILANIKTRQAMRHFFDRGCTGIKWRRRFPHASKEEIREFLDIFTEAFGFKQSRRLCFAPDDRVMDVYRTLYGGQPLADDMELETLVSDLQKRYRVDILSSWREDITVGDLFVKSRRTAP
jgi:hypothetical protein